MPNLWCKYTCWTLLCCSSKPTGGSGGSFGQENTLKSGHFNHKNITIPSDWMCNSCGCVNFARRTSCFQVWIFVLLPLIFHHPVSLLGLLWSERIFQMQSNLFFGWWLYTKPILLTNSSTLLVLEEVPFELEFVGCNMGNQNYLY